MAWKIIGVGNLIFAAVNVGLESYGFAALNALAFFYCMFGAVIDAINKTRSSARWMKARSG